MAKQWKCKDCGAYVSKGAFASVRASPERCDDCGGTEFESPIVSGPFDSVIDRLT